MGVFTTHIDDNIGCGEAGPIPRAQRYVEGRLEALKPQGDVFTHVSMEQFWEKDCPVTVTQTKFADKSALTPTFTESWKAWRRPRSLEETLSRQFKLGGISWSATVSPFHLPAAG